jgi:hypothetical protein
LGWRRSELSSLLLPEDVRLYPDRVAVALALLKLTRMAAKAGKRCCLVGDVG